MPVQTCPACRYCDGPQSFPPARQALKAEQSSEFSSSGAARRDRSHVQNRNLARRKRHSGLSDLGFQQGQFVYVVKADNTVESRPVTPGRAFGKKMVIEKGLAPGDTVVIDGQLRLFPGAQVQLVDPAKVDMGKS